MRVSILLCTVALAACGKPNLDPAPAPDASSAKVVVRGFAEAMVEGNLNKAARFLPDDKACDSAPEDERQECKRRVPLMHKRLKVMVKMLKGFPLGKVAESKESNPDPLVQSWAFYAKGTDKSAGAILVVQLGGRFYAAFPVKAAPGQKKQVWKAKLSKYTSFEHPLTLPAGKAFQIKVTHTGGKVGRVVLSVFAAKSRATVSSDTMTCSKSGCSMSVGLASSARSRHLSVKCEVSTDMSVRLEVSEKRR